MNELTLNKKTMSSIELVATINPLSKIEGICRRLYRGGDSEDLYKVWDNLDELSLPAHLEMVLTNAIARGISFQKNISRDRPTITYLVKNTTTGFYKIGRTTQKDAGIRMAQFAGMTGGECVLLKQIEGDVETHLHKKYANKRAKGEWFLLSDNDVKDIILI